MQHKDRIQLEFQLSKKAAPHEKKIVQFGFVPHTTVLLDVYTIEEIIRQKIACVLSRKEGKDYFDLYYLLDLGHKPLHLGKLEKEKILAAIPSDEKEIRFLANVINHYIPRNKRPMWGMFLEELREKIWKE
ncbi:MAG: nucleotidyl transferase AbiEii/AbiGii toxin family protein [Nanoarchaeota archaeon]